MHGAASVALADCQVKKDSFSGQFEIIVPEKRSRVELSPRKFKLPENIRAIDPDVSNEVTIEELFLLSQMQHVNVSVKTLLESQRV